MEDIFSGIEQWVKDKKRFALATVIQTWGSAPRPVGSSMAISEDMEILGSVSGGCIEGAVIKEAIDILKDGQPKVINYGVTDEDAWSVGLSCGGKVTVFVEGFPACSESAPEQHIWKVLQQARSQDESIVYLSRLNGQASEHTILYPKGEIIGRYDDALLAFGNKAYQERKNQRASLSSGEWFAQVFSHKPKLLIIGAAHITVDLVSLGKQFGFETIVIDPRGIFVDKTQFRDQPNQLMGDWPAEVLPNIDLDAYSYAVLLSHDPKIDDQALHILLKSEIAYIGALGSKRTQAKRVKRLEEAGFSAADIGRIHGPVGISINAKKPREIALSIMAQIIEVQNEYA